MPSGAAITSPSAVWIRLPTIEFNNPPATPGGAVILVKTSSDSPPTPFQNSAPRIRTSQPRPNAVAAHASAIQIALRRLRAG